MAGETDLKQGEKKTSSDGDRSEKETSKDSSNKEEEEVTLPKSELQKLKEERENYKKGLLSTKEELKKYKKDNKEELPSNDGGEDLDSPITKKDFYRANEKEAIKKATEDPEINNNFDEIMEYFTSRRGKETVEDIVKDIEDAKTLHDKYKSSGDTSENKEASSQLSSEKKKPSGGSRQGKEKRRKKILPRNSSPEEWYGKND